MSKIINKFKNLPIHKGQHFSGKSMCVPGQEVTADEILRRYSQGFPIPQKVYTHVGIQQFQNLSLLDQMDYLRELHDTNRASSQSIKLAQERVQKLHAKAEKDAHEALIRQKVIDELKGQKT